MPVFQALSAFSAINLARLSHLAGIGTHKCNGMSKEYAKVFTTKTGLN
jgi:hypothetical protein